MEKEKRKSHNLVKVILLGSEKCGKTQLVLTMVKKSSPYDPFAFSSTQVEIDWFGTPFVLEFLDSSSSDRLTVLRDVHLREGDAFLFSYSIHSRSSFEEVEKNFEEVMRVKEKAIPGVLIAIDHDNSHSRKISYQEGEELAKRLGCGFLEVLLTDPETSVRCISAITTAYMKIEEVNKKKSPKLRRYFSFLKASFSKKIKS